MNNPGLDSPTLERLKEKWADLQSKGHSLGIEFRLITHPQDEKNVLAIDVVQKIDSDVLTETVQRNAAEAYAVLRIAGLSLEALVEAYKNQLRKLLIEMDQKDMDLVVTMTPTSPTSGEVRGYLGAENAGAAGSIQLNYVHYYLLTALREKVAQVTGDRWNVVKAVYRSGELEFYFEY